MHSKVDGKAVVFIGWTTKKNNKIYQWNDCELETITEILFGKENIKTLKKIHKVLLRYKKDDI